MRVLIDTNIIIDAAARRIPFASAAREVLALCGNSAIEGYVSSHTYSDVFYILRKGMPPDERRDMLKQLRNYLGTVAVTGKIIDTALDRDGISDFEEAIQYACAEAIGADYIVTRDLKDYKQAGIEAVTAEELLKRLV